MKLETPTLFFFFFGIWLSILVVLRHDINAIEPSRLQEDGLDLFSSDRSPGPSSHSCSEENIKSSSVILMWQQIMKSKFQAVRT
jgi:hypothetical protein